MVIFLFWAKLLAKNISELVSRAWSPSPPSYACTPVRCLLWARLNNSSMICQWKLESGFASAQKSTNSSLVCRSCGPVRVRWGARTHAARLCREPTSRVPRPISSATTDPRKPFHFRFPALPLSSTSPKFPALPFSFTSTFLHIRFHPLPLSCTSAFIHFRFPALPLSYTSALLHFCYTALRFPALLLSCTSVSVHLSIRSHSNWTGFIHWTHSVPSALV